MGPPKAALPLPRQRSTCTLATPAGCFPPSSAAGSEVIIKIANRYNTYAFGGQKHLMITTNSWMGGEDITLPILYIVSGVCVCARARARVCVCARVGACVSVHVWATECLPGTLRLCKALGLCICSVRFLYGWRVETFAWGWRRVHGGGGVCVCMRDLVHLDASCFSMAVGFPTTTRPDLGPSFPHAGGLSLFASLFFIFSYNMGLVWKRPLGDLDELSWVKEEQKVMANRLPPQLKMEHRQAAQQAQQQQQGTGTRPPTAISAAG
jgi:hypothetical protein